MIFGITGDPQSGKDTLANALREELPQGSAAILHFADPLKRVVSDLFNVPLESLHTGAGKAATNDWGMTNRGLLRRFGTEVARQVHPDVWTRYLKRAVLTTRSMGRMIYFIVPDMRFPNELEAIRDLGLQLAGGHTLIRVERAGALGSIHLSDTALADVRMNVVYNNGDAPDLRRAARVILSIVNGDLVPPPNHHWVYDCALKQLTFNSAGKP